MADKILLVEDESIEALDIKRTLESFGYEVPYVASNGEEAVKKALEIKPDLILMDIILKGKTDGIDAALEIKKFNIPVIFLTAHPEESTIERAKLTEPYGYLTKPYNTIELKYSIELAIYRNKMQEELKESEKNYRNLFETMDQGVVYQDKNGEILSANPAAEEILGLTINEMQGRNSKDPRWKCIHEDGSDFPCEEHPAMVALKTGKKVKNVVMGFFNPKKRKTRWITINATPKFREGEYKPYQVYNIFEDISQRKQMEEKLGGSEAKLEAVIESMNDAVFISDKEGNFIEFNEAFATYHKFKNKEECYKTLSEYPDYVNVYFDNGTLAPLDMWAVPRALRGETVSSAEYIIERKDTGEKWWGNYSFGPIRDKEGEITGSVVVARDITEIKESEKRLRESEKKYRHALDNMMEGCQLIDYDWRYIYVNDAATRHARVVKEDLDGRSMMEVYPGIGESEMFKILESAMKKRTSHHLEIYFTFPDGTGQWFELSVFPVPEGIFILSFDIDDRKNLEIKLMESEQKFKTVADFTYDWEYWVSPNGDLLYVSPSCERISGYTPEEFIEEPKLLVKIIHPDDKKLFLKHENDFNEMRVGGEIEFRIIRKDGEEIWISHNCQPVFNEEGEFLGQRASNEDINERHLAIQQIEESEEQLRFITDNMSDVVGQINSEGIITYFSPSIKQFTGFNPSDVLGKGLSDLVHPDDQEIVSGVIQQAIITRQPVTIEYQVKKSDGSYLWVEALGKAVYDAEGNFESLVFNSRDITDRKNAEKELKHSEEKYRHVVETAAEGITLFDRKGTVIETNLKTLELLGFEKDEVVGRNLIQMIPSIKIDAKEVLGAFKDILMGKSLKKTEWGFINKKGHQKFAKVHYSPMKKEGKIIGIALILEDITELKLREKSLENSLDEKEVLLREIHHRVKNNMQIISSLLNLQRSYVQEDETRNVLKDSQSRVKSMAMIHEKLYMSRDLSHINFKDYTEKLVSDIFYTYGIKKGTIEAIFKVEDIEMNMETAIPLGLIINELVTNSLKFAFPEMDEGSVTVEMKTSNGDHTLIIADNGIGVPENFNFKKTESLGLQLVNSLVHQIDGEITLERSHGTEFKITFKELDYKKRF
ncbi:PAS domain S-box protein [Methanobacterium subterraneum]|uniref:PAS domain S-box protein n=1 Tax=Methanobacterium subterraneum TaxID=59277 RepID=A0A7K4DJK3_9EURY|nr:PAS domain S-box protein [Methanobacterium subterraneum]NMO08459.1 PAS domain S-box protein [Methanobacterium subterraneum]